MTRSCEHCGRIFDAVNNAQRFCSVECRELRSQGKRAEAKRRYKQKQRIASGKRKQGMTAMEINAEAMKEGMSYGKRVAATEYQVKIVRKW